MTTGLPAEKQQWLGVLLLLLMLLVVGKASLHCLGFSLLLQLVLKVIFLCPVGVTAKSKASELAGSITGQLLCERKVTNKVYML